LARPGPARLALLGYGEQAGQHLRAIREVRPIASAVVWGRHRDRAEAFSRRVGDELGIAIDIADSAEDAVVRADIVCALTPSTEPILEGAWLASGTHVNLVGAGHAGQAEADIDLVARARFIVDSREGVSAQGGEFLRAKAAGRVDDSHIAAEIGAVLSGAAQGRITQNEVTVYKSLGHVVQDLACAWALYTGEGVEA
jgi:ornithine cyclodeaminase